MRQIFQIAQWYMPIELISILNAVIAQSKQSLIMYGPLKTKKNFLLNQGI